MSRQKLQGKVPTRSNTPYYMSNFSKPSRDPHSSTISIKQCKVDNEPYDLTLHETREQLTHTIHLPWTLDAALYTMLGENKSDIVGVKGARDMSQPRNNPRLRTGQPFRSRTAAIKGVWSSLVGRCNDHVATSCVSVTWASAQDLHRTLIIKQHKNISKRKKQTFMFRSLIVWTFEYFFCSSD